MLFPTASRQPRPIRLPEELRAWAWESLHGKYGDEAMEHPWIVLDEIKNFSTLSPTEQYDIAITQIARQAPLRICPQEQVCGSATLGFGIRHKVPAYYKDGCVFHSVSHLTINYKRVLQEGLHSYCEEIRQRLQDPTLTDPQREFLRSLENVIASIGIWHGRYLIATQSTRPDLHKLLQQVPFQPARTFHEALQSVWFIFAFVRLCGNWPGIGRLDQLLGPYLVKDLADGTLTLSQARELLASFFIKGCEWIRSEPPAGSGDAQHYQNIVLSGRDPEGRDMTNDVTYLILDVVEELAISDFPITVRLRQNSPQKLKTRIAEVMRHGGGIVAVYHEELILKALQDLEYPIEEACNFANDGCWEVQIPGKTDFAYFPFDALQIFNQVIGLDQDPIPDFPSAEALYEAFCDQLSKALHTQYRENLLEKFCCRDGAWQAAQPPRPTSVVSLFEDGCIQNARSYYDFGPCYVVRSPHIGGAPDVANSLYAIEKLVFKEKKLSFRQLVKILRANWDGQEALRLYVKNRYCYYGNDFEEADIWHTRLLNDFAELVSRCPKPEGPPIRFIPGVSTFGRQISWLPHRGATAFGCKKGEILSGNDSPAPGTDSSGATAIIKSHCKADLHRQSCGAALDIKLYPDSLSGEKGIAALIALLEGFLALDGFFLQLDAVDTQTLLDAQKNPERYKTLSVRISGWNARFVTLNQEWQNMIIQRSLQNPS